MEQPRMAFKIVATEGNADGRSEEPSKLQKLSVLMPIYNERWTLREIVTRVLSAQVPLEIELVAVDDCSTDGSWEELQELAKLDARIVAVRQPKNQGKASAIRTAIAQMTGEVAVIQDADLEYDPSDYVQMLAPILEQKADAVFGSRLAGNKRRVMSFWHSLANRVLTSAANVLNDLNLTDMETCYKMVRADILKQLRLTSEGFAIEPELTCRLAQWGARIYEVPIDYSGRTYAEGKKIRAIDGLKAIWAMIRSRFFDTQFTDHSGFYILSSVAKASGYNRWILDQVQPYLGRRILEAGAGIGNLSQMLINRDRLIMVDYETMYTNALKQRYGGRENVRIDQADLTKRTDFHRWRSEAVETILCSNVLEHLEPDEQVLSSFYETLAPGGHCIIVVPAGQWLYTPMDKELGHFRRYSQQELAEKMRGAGFEVAFTRQFSKVGSISWGIAGHVLKRRHLSPMQMVWFDRMLPIFRVLEYALPIPGMSLIMVGQKPKQLAVRKAA